MQEWKTTQLKSLPYSKTNLFKSYSFHYWILRLSKKFSCLPEINSKSLITENKSGLGSTFSKVHSRLGDNGAMSAKLKRKRNMIQKYCIQPRSCSRIKTTDRSFQMWKNKRIIACISFLEGSKNDPGVESSQSRSEQRPRGKQWLLTRWTLGDGKVPALEARVAQVLCDQSSSSSGRKAVDMVCSGQRVSPCKVF